MTIETETPIVPLPDLPEGEIDISGDRGVLKKILQEGTGLETPGNGCNVSLHYTGKLLDGTKFDSSLDRNQPFEFSLGKGSVIKAFDMGIATMKLNEKCILTCAAPYAYGAGGSPPNIPPNATLQFELEMLGWKGEDLSPKSDNSIERFIVKASDKSSKKTPNDGAHVKINLIGKFEERVFDEREVEFMLGEGSESNVIEGVEIALEKMKQNETSRLVIKARYAFGAAGNKDFEIPENSTVEYLVTLIEFEREADTWKMDQKDSLEQAKSLKEKGTKYLKELKYKLALKMYQKGLAYLSNCDNEESKEVRVAINLNISLCHQKQNEHFEAKGACNIVLTIDKDNVKALYRRGQSILTMGEIDNALLDFQRVLELEPTNKAALNQVTVCKKKISDYNNKQKQVYSKMFDRFAAVDKQKEDDILSQQEDVMSSCGQWIEEEQTEEKKLQQAEYLAKEAEYQKQKHNIIMLNEGDVEI